MSALLTIISFWWDSRELLFGVDPRLVATLGFVAFAVIMVAHLVSYHSRLMSRMPNIVIGKREGHDNPYVNFVQMSSERDTQFTSSGKVAKLGLTSMAHVKLANKPKNPTDLNDALDVRGEITYFDMDKKPRVGAIEGRWGDRGQPSKEMSPEERREILHMKLPSSGDWRGMDISMRYKGEEDWYAYSNDCYKRDDWKLDSHKLPLVDKMHVRVDLYGKIFKHKRFWFTLHKLKRDEWPNIKIEEGKN